MVCRFAPRALDVTGLGTIDSVKSSERLSTNGIGLVGNSYNVALSISTSSVISSTVGINAPSTVHLSPKEIYDLHPVKKIGVFCAYVFERHSRV